MTHILDKCLVECKSVYLLGDLNVDFNLSPHVLSDVLDAYNLRNVVKEPTCFKSKTNPTLIDVILTNTPERLASHLNVSIGVSDFHNIVCASTKMHAPSTAPPRVVNYRTYKHFNEDDFTQDIAKAPFQVGEIFDDIDDKMWFYNNLLINVIETHAPMKRKLLKCKQVPYMNGKLRKAINVKAMLRRKFDKYRTDTAWFKYKAQRNLATNLKRASIRQYFAERCSNNSKDFWKTIQPFMSDKHENKGRHISILEDNRIISNDNEVCNVFNDFFVNMASNLSEPCHIKDIPTEQLIDYYDDHPSIRMIVPSQRLDSKKSVLPKCYWNSKASKQTKHMGMTWYQPNF